MDSSSQLLLGLAGFGEVLLMKSSNLAVFQKPDPMLLESGHSDNYQLIAAANAASGLCPAMKVRSCGRSTRLNTIA